MSEAQKAKELLRDLSAEERQEARESARALYIRKLGDPPSKRSVRISTEQPVYMFSIGIFLLLVLAVAGGYVSFTRVTYAGEGLYLRTFGEVVEDNAIDARHFNKTWYAYDAGVFANAKATGIATFVLSEVSAIIGVLGWSVLFESNDNKKRFMLIPVITGMSIAFVANVVVTEPNDLLTGLDAFIPPSVVLSVALVLERIVILLIARWYAVEVEYVRQDEHYHAQIEAYEKDPSWPQFYADALRDRLIKKNATGAGEKAKKRRETLKLLTFDDWRELVGYEVKKDKWFSGNFTEISGNQGEKKAVTQFELESIFAEKPELLGLKGIEISEITGASPATVSRVRRAIKNGK